MDYKPADFFVGVMDFFTILLPGALLTFVLRDVGTPVFGAALPALNTAAEKWIAFIVSSYILGHLLHHLGSVLDYFYDWLYVKKWRRRHGKEDLLVKSQELMANQLGWVRMPSVFSWAASFVRANNDTAAGELERSGADSKFFRSLTIVLLAGGAIMWSRVGWYGALACFALMLVSFWRFCDRRWQTSQLTYEYFIMLNLPSAKKSSAKA